jgi:hypothetical protein
MGVDKDEYLSLQKTIKRHSIMMIYKLLIKERF